MFGELMAWATALSRMEPLEPSLYERTECEIFLGNWTVACRAAGSLLPALGSMAERFVEVSQYALMEVVWRSDAPLQLSESAVMESPKMLEALCRLTGPTVVTGTFWMVLVRHWRAVYQSHPGHRLLPTVKSALLDQLRSATDRDCLWESAWEGIKMIDEEIAAEANAIDNMRR